MNVRQSFTPLYFICPGEGTDQSKRQVKRIPKVIELGDKQEKLAKLECQLRKANEYTGELEEVLRAKHKEVVETNSQLSDYITVNNNLRSKIKKMEDAMMKEREKCTKSKVELINMKGKYQRLEKHLQDVQDANKIDSRLMQERLSFTAFEAENMKSKAQAQHKKLVDLQRMLTHTIAEHKEFQCDEIELDSASADDEANKNAKSKLNILEEENSRLSNALTCSVCSNMYSASGHHIPAKLRCCHIFCKSCVGKWLDENRGQHKTASCPTCRTYYSRQDINLINLYPI